MSNNNVNAPLEITDAKKQQWPSSFFGCMSYKNHEGNSIFCPTFCPLAILCTNSLVGKVYSKLHNEPVVCCEVGKVGLCMCIALIPLGIATPFSGFGIYCCLSNYFRHRTLKEYNIEEETVCCLGPNASGPVNFCFHGVCYPCSIFQVYIALTHFAATPTGKGSVNPQ